MTEIRTDELVALQREEADSYFSFFFTLNGLTVFENNLAPFAHPVNAR